MVFEFPQNNKDEPETSPTPPAEIHEISDEELKKGLKPMENRKAPVQMV
jgi:hypothetical protein